MKKLRRASKKNLRVDLKLSRRGFIAKTALAASAITIVPRHVLGKGFVAPSDTINLGFIGLGKQSGGLAARFIESTNAQIVAGSDVWSTKNTWFKNYVEELYAEKRNNTGFKGIDTTRNYKELLARKDVDAVIIATPDHWHAIQAIEAMEAGKDIYCEKPLTQTIQEGIEMVKTVRKTGSILQTGSMQRSREDFRKACELVRNGYLGEVSKVLVNVGDPAIPFNMMAEKTPKEVDWNLWCGPSPMLPYNQRLSPPESTSFFPDWRLFRETGGGILTDWGAHMFDIAQWGLGMDHTGPVKFVPPSDRKAARGMQMFYENGVEMVHEDFGRGWGVRFIGSEGSLDISRQYFDTNPTSLMTAEPKPSDIKLYDSNGNHYQDWLDAIKNRSEPLCPVETGHRSATVGNICNIAYQLGRTLEWNPEKEKFSGDREANKLKKRKNRKFE